MSEAYARAWVWIMLELVESSGRSRDNFMTWVSLPCEVKSDYILPGSLSSVWFLGAFGMQVSCSGYSCAVCFSWDSLCSLDSSIIAQALVLPYYEGSGVVNERWRWHLILSKDSQGHNGWNVKMNWDSNVRYFSDKQYIGTCEYWIYIMALVHSLQFTSSSSSCSYKASRTTIIHKTVTKNWMYSTWQFY